MNMQALPNQSAALSASESTCVLLQDYAALRDYTGTANVVYVTGSMGAFSASQISGVFQFDAADATSADNGGTIVVDAAGRRWRRHISDMVNVCWFGASPDGGIGYGTDNTDLISNAINFCNATNLGIFFPAPADGNNYSISGPLPSFSSAGGWVQERIGYDYASGGCILAKMPAGGSPYTAVTITGSPTRVSVFVSCTPDKPNIGCLLFENPARLNAERVRVAHSGSFGVKMNKVWDSVFHDISVELCGSALDYAFSMNDDGDTCNMTHILRLQVEQSTTKAIYISPNALSCVFDNVHAERQNSPESGGNMFVFGGNRCQYNCVRIDSFDSSNARALIAGANTSIIGYLCEQSITTLYDVQQNSTLTLVSPEIQGTLRTQTNQTGKLILVGGIVQATSEIQGIQCSATTINNLDIGYTPNADVSRNVFRDCRVGALTGNSSFAAASFFGGEIANPGNFLAGKTLLDGVIARQYSGDTITLGYRSLVARNGTRIEAPLNVDFGGIQADDTTFASNLSQTAGPNISRFNDGVIVLGNVSGIGGQPDASAFSEGSYTRNLAAAAGSPRGWMKISGAWRSVGNLA